MITAKPLLACDVTEEEHGRYGSLPLQMLVSKKYDGIRGRSWKGKLYSRTNELLPNRGLQDWAKRLPSGLEGEIVCFNVEGDRVCSIEENESIIMSRDSGWIEFEFVCFDYIPSKEYLRYTFQERLNELRFLYDAIENPGFNLVEHELVQTQWRYLDARLKDVVQDGWEGLVLRDPKGLYKQGRTTGRNGSFEMMRMKPWLTEEAVLRGIEFEQTNTNPAKQNKIGYQKRSSHKSGMVQDRTRAGVLICEDRDGQEVRIGTGMTDRDKEFFASLQIKSKYPMIQFRYRTKTKYGAYRSPSYLRIRKEGI